MQKHCSSFTVAVVYQIQCQKATSQLPKYIDTHTHTHTHTQTLIHITKREQYDENRKFLKGKAIIGMLKTCNDELSSS